MDKIYSRKRINLPKIKRKPRKKRPSSKIKHFFLLLLGLLLLAMGIFLYTAYPIFVASCKTAASSKATHIVSDEVKNVMSDYSYQDLVEIEKDGNGDIVLMKYNTILINEITSKIATNIQNAIDNTPRITVYINFGSVSGVSLLKNLGPQFDIELEAAGMIDTNLESKFESFNVNQTMHKIYLNLTTSLSILTPFGVYGSDLDSNVLLTEAVIVGDVPDTYYNLEGLNQENTLDLLE